MVEDKFISSISANTTTKNTGSNFINNNSNPIKNKFSIETTKLPAFKQQENNLFLTKNKAASSTKIQSPLLSNSTTIGRTNDIKDKERKKSELEEILQSRRESIEGKRFSINNNKPIKQQTTTYNNNSHKTSVQATLSPSLSNNHNKTDNLIISNAEEPFEKPTTAENINNADTAVDEKGSAHKHKSKKHHKEKKRDTENTRTNGELKETRKPSTFKEQLEEENRRKSSIQHSVTLVKRVLTVSEDQKSKSNSDFDYSKMPRADDLSMDEMREAFLIFDRKGDDKIGTSDVGNLLRSLGLVPTEAVVKKVGGTDIGGETRITFEEFLPMYQEAAKVKDNGTYEDFIEIMKVYDKEGDGTILAAELRHVLLSLGERLKENDVDEIVQGKENADGYIEYEPFVRSVMNP